MVIIFSSNNISYICAGENVTVSENVNIYEGIEFIDYDDSDIETMIRIVMHLCYLQRDNEKIPEDIVNTL